MNKLLQQRGRWFLIGFLLAILVGLTLLAGLGEWGAGGLVLLSGLTLIGGLGLTSLGLSRLDGGGEADATKLEQDLQRAREQIYQLTRDLRFRMEQLVGERDQAEFLHQSLIELASSLEPRRVLSGILRRAIVAAGADCGSILLLDETGQPNQFFLSRLSGPEETSRRGTAVLTEGFAGWVVSNQRGDVVFDTSQDNRWIHFEDKGMPRSAVGVPFLRRGRVLGVIVLTHSLPFQFEEFHLALLEQLAHQAALCLENADLFTEAEDERRKLAAILEGTTEAVIVVNQEGQVLLLNGAAEEVFHVQAEDVLEQPLQKGIDHEGLLNLFAQARECGEAISGELSGEGLRVYACSLTPVPGVGWVAVLPDITHLKELDRLKSEFVATVSHDMRSPLTVLNGYAELVSSQGPVTVEQADSLNQIRAIVSQLNQLVSDLLDLGRIEAGINMEMHPCQIEEGVTETVDLHLPTALDKGLDLQVQIEGHLPPIEGNIDRIRQVVSNLVDNAIKYTPAPGTIWVRLYRREQEVVLEVKDTGLGIAPHDQQKLFDKFHRVRTSQTEEIPGTGLGLAIVRSIIEQHSGRTWVRSAVGEGSTFGVALPVLEEATTADSP